MIKENEPHYNGSFCYAYIIQQILFYQRNACEQLFRRQRKWISTHKINTVDLIRKPAVADVISAESAAQGMAKMRQAFIFYKRAYDDASQNALWQYMLEYFVKRYELTAKEKLNTNVLDTQLKYSIRLYCYGTVGMTKEWLLNDNTTSAEAVVAMMFASMPENMKKVYF